MIQANFQSDEVLSLFSGAGGFSYGFAQAGLKPVCGVDIDHDACASYETNVGGICHKLLGGGDLCSGMAQARYRRVHCEIKLYSLYAFHSYQSARH